MKVQKWVSGQVGSGTSSGREGCWAGQRRAKWVAWSVTARSNNKVTSTEHKAHRPRELDGRVRKARSRLVLLKADGGWFS
ncbi:hypothetical protein CsSME_00019652 [Camellia sinensis var. sinensis]